MTHGTCTGRFQKKAKVCVGWGGVGGEKKRKPETENEYGGG